MMCGDVGALLCPLECCFLALLKCMSFHVPFREHRMEIFLSQPCGWYSYSFDLCLSWKSLADRFEGSRNRAHGYKDLTSTKQIARLWCSSNTIFILTS